MRDYISKDDLIDTLDECIDKCEQMLPLTPAQVHETRGEINATKAIRVFVKMLDAADVREHVRGHWYLNGACSNCGKQTMQSYPNYCCYCGADMRPSDGDD